jgi:hypothetical protein
VSAAIEQGFVVEILDSLGIVTAAAIIDTRLRRDQFGIPTTFNMLPAWPVTGLAPYVSEFGSLGIRNKTALFVSGCMTAKTSFLFLDLEFGQHFLDSIPGMCLFGIFHESGIFIVMTIGTRFRTHIVSGPGWPGHEHTSQNPEHG